MGQTSMKYSRPGTSDGQTVRISRTRIKWEHEECTHATASAFNWMSQKIKRVASRKIVLDMSACKYLNVSGLHSLIEWNNDLVRQGIDMRVSGLSPTVARIFRITKLEWLLADPV